MLKLVVSGQEFFNELTNEVKITKDTELQLEHSLLSISKWEAKWHKPFFKDEEKTNDEIMDYIRCMTLNQNVDPLVYKCLTNADVVKIKEYIDDPMTATWFSDISGQSSRNEVITNELIYYWMIALQIPFECQKWHINRLLTLIKVCNIKNAPSKKMSKDEIRRRNAEINAKRRAAMHSKG